MVNDAISSEFHSVHYVQIDSAVGTIRRFGRRTLLAKLNLIVFHLILFTPSGEGLGEGF